MTRERLRWRLVSGTMLCKVAIGGVQGTGTVGKEWPVLTDFEKSRAWQALRYGDSDRVDQTSIILGQLKNIEMSRLHQPKVHV